MKGKTLEKALREAVEANDRYASAFTDGATTSEQLDRLYDLTLTTARYLVRDHRDELLSLVGGWVPVSERLPDSDREVFVMYRNSSFRYKRHRARYSGGAWRFVDAKDENQKALMYEYQGEVKAWHEQPELPAPPQEDEK